MNDCQYSGFAAVFHDITLPIELPKDKRVSSEDAAPHIPDFPFKPLFRATADMNPSFRFDDVDVLVSRNSLRKLLQFSAGKQKRLASFRIDLHLIDGTLVMERCEKDAHRMVSGDGHYGWGKSFESAFTKYPTGLEDSTAHHRALRYQLGELACVVCFEVDACYVPKSEAGGESESLPPLPKVPLLASAMDQLLIINDGPVGNTTAIRSPMPQTTAAEIKTAMKPEKLEAYLPQVWFGRTPWLIIARHKNGTFKTVEVTHVEAEFAGWEEKHQADLRKLVAVLAQLREAVRENGGGHCVAVYESHMDPQALRVYPSAVAKEAIPDDLRRKLWDSEGGSGLSAS